ncbi:hypothetical protein [Desulfosporosinus sp. Sb-LF]|uniref:hypothetical protein n=1 Tax=Desulfosporosinus sp. Sb-LF TaxID=2560027 RepID=UPI00107F36DA|nr:hypothetical protein [Desulfosporosinus sp. Sb-LF]TGE31274.1 hypothetical protein E4K68_18195 [Desulfosporosinus sp. Sb-LF]
MPERILKYGGAKIRNLVPPVKINRFVNRLPKNKRDSLFEIASELQAAGLIDVLNGRSQSTIDKDTIDDQMTNTGNSAHDIQGLKRNTKDTLNLPK